ncbi:hypothetical protein [Allobranchiibius sp. CTAmp26]|uniref:hypothetical protein n=1 Tax=Allobranchiibius sp. CTAmp26 TaxID=2815214 RepID=UPI001AA1BE06|nr:hypothetical protein [Allobranchiibius sp. CTAmp26]MBO1755124.1 hypothetical protein [Allobranchiibius sp. CTAmp26]
MPKLNQPVDVDGFWRDGFTIVRNVYSDEEIEQFREQCRAGGGGKGDLLARPGLRSAITDGAMAEIARKILRSDNLMYGGDSAFTINPTLRGWHKDNTDRQDGNGPDWKSDYTQLRFGIYLQDHTKYSGGLNLRKASQNTVDHSKGEILYLKNRPGDIGVWSMRITHSANGDLLRWPRGGTTDPAHLPEKISKWKLAPKVEERMAIFAAIGLDDEHSRRYYDYLKTRKYMVDQWRAAPYDEQARAALESTGVRLRDMPAEVDGDETAGLNVAWQPTPY